MGGGGGDGAMDDDDVVFVMETFCFDFAYSARVVARARAANMHREILNQIADKCPHCR